jgi:hypothetical protein
MKTMGPRILPTLLKTSLTAMTVERHCGRLTLSSMVRMQGPGTLSSRPRQKSTSAWRTSVRRKASEESWKSDAMRGREMK